MAKDMMKAIFEAEEECKAREAQAKAQAAQDAENAKAEAKKLIDDAKAQAQAEASQLFEELKMEGAKELDQSMKTAENRCAVISKMAEKNRDKVIKAVVEKLTS